MKSDDCSKGDKKYIISVDIGTTRLRCHIYDKNGLTVSESSATINLLCAERGYQEIDCDQLWTAFVECVTDAIHKKELNKNEIICMGISTLRGTFVTWDRETALPYHNFICWKDIRAEQLCQQWNKSFYFNCLKFGAKFLHFFTRSQRFLAASLLKFTTGMVVMRLLWVLENIPVVRQRAMEENAMYGTVDTYLVWRLTGGKVHATDPSNACISGFFDPFHVEWAQWALDLFNIPSSMLPTVIDTNGDFGATLPEIFGESIPIRTVVGDQQAAMFGERCFNKGDVKCTLGTGAFIDINTGLTPFSSYKGLYPIIGWKTVDSPKPVYLAEGGAYDTGTAILWAQDIGLLSDASETSDIAISVPNSEVYFVPAFFGLQAPINDNYATAAFIGIKSNTTKAQLVKSILESICFRVKQMYDIMRDEAGFDLKRFRVDGGVSNNDFVVQLISDLTGKEVERCSHSEMSSLGTAFLAGSATGVWNDINDISQLKISAKIFYPRNTFTERYRKIFANWERAVERCLHWHS